MAKIKVKNQHIQLTDEKRGDKLTNRCLTTDVREKGFYLKAWRGECEFDIEYQGNHNIDIHTENILPVKDGVFEIDILLDAPPISNEFTYKIISKNLDFHYQPAPTQEEIDLYDYYLPENAIGSYAVYHSSKMNNYIHADGTETNYGTGKAFHIFRPKAIDANGDWVWCELLIEKDKRLVVTVPQDFLDNAVYPVVVDPEIGYSTAGGGAATYTDGRGMRNATYHYTGVTGDEVVSYHLHCHNFNSASVSSFEIATYDVTSGLPDNRTHTATTISFSLVPAGAWQVSAATTDALVNGTVYTVAYCQTANTVRVSRDSSGTSTSVDASATTGCPATWSESGGSSALISQFATVVNGGGGVEETITSDAHIDRTETETITSDAHIKDVITETITSDSHIKGVVTETILSDAHVKGSVTETITADAHIKGVVTETITSDAHISDSVTETILSDAHISDSVTETITSDAHIKDVITETITSDSHIKGVVTGTITSDAEISVAGTEIETITSDAHIDRTETETILSDAHIKDVITETITSDAEISIGTSTVTETVTSDAHIKDVITETITSDAHVLKQITETITSDAEIGGSVLETITSDAEIASAVSYVKVGTVTHGTVSELSSIKNGGVSKIDTVTHSTLAEINTIKHG